MPSMPMPAALAAAADAGRELPALTVDDATWTRAELVRRAAAVAQALRTAGVGQDDFVSIVLPNGHDFIAVAFGALMLGATPQPLSSRIAVGELDAIVELTAPAAVVVAPGMTAPSSARTVMTINAVGPGPEPIPAAFRQAVARSWKAPTSGGSTGRPKVIVSGAPSTVDPDDPALARILRLPTDGCVVVPGPLDHNAPFGFVMNALLRRNHVVLSSRFDPLATLAQIEAHRASYVLLVPTMMSRIVQLDVAQRERFDISSLRTVMHAAAPCPPAVKRAWMAWVGDATVLEHYGGTEGQALTTIDGAEWRRRPGSVGRTAIGEIAILGEDGEPVAPGVVGEIFMRPGPDAPPTYRYIGADARRGEDGWESIGDLGHVDEEGYVFLADRRQDLILRGGANIYPAEVEHALQEHPLVEEAVVIGLPDPDLGQAVHALVRTDAELTAEQLDEHLRDRLSRYKVPSSYEFVREPLRDESGKVRRAAIRAARA